jgi:hypothetical protein
MELENFRSTFVGNLWNFQAGTVEILLVQMKRQRKLLVFNRMIFVFEDSS